MIGEGHPVEFLDVEDVLCLHELTIEADGGRSGLRDAGLLDAAVAMPRQQFRGQMLHEGMAAIAAAYMFHLARNHPFVDGNKRVAVLAALVFLDVNRIGGLPSPKELESYTLSVAAGTMSKTELTNWLREVIHE